MRYLKIGGAALAALVLAGVAAVIIQDRLSQPPAPDRASLIAQAAHYHARIQRDHYGVPHISGPRDPVDGNGVYGRATNNPITRQWKQQIQHNR